MRYILANDQEDIWDTRRTMASHPELQLCRRFLRVPGYGSLWHPGRGWIAFPSPISGGSVFCILRFLRAGSRSEVLYWSSLSYNEEEKAEHLTRIAINRASHMMNAAACCYNSNYWGSDSDSSKGILDSVHKPALDAIKVLIGGGIDLSKEVHSMPALDATKVLIGSRIDLSKEVRMHPMPGLLDFFMGCLQSKARKIDLSKELHLLARIEHALSKMHNELSAMLFIMPSFASLIYRRPSIEITGLLSEFVHLVLQRAKRRTNNTVLSLPYVCIGEMCYELFFGCRILMNLSEGLAIHFINEAISHGPKWDKARQTFLQKLLPKVSVHPSLNELREYDVVAAKAGDRLRNEFLERAELKPPQVLRMIDCKATREEGQVVLMDWKDCEQAWGYSTISHTYGQDVYQVFNCTCASICRAAQKPRCSFDTCPHDPAAPNAAHTATQTRVVRDILNMCGTLCDTGVRYAWHDGVCIAQQDEDEVRETIQHIGWVYSNGRETIIFLHYVGKPMAPIRVSSEDPVCRWHTRVWTFQEAALSKHRRYCIRVGQKAIGKCESLEDFIKNVDLLYEDESSSVEVVEEERFYDILKLLSLNILSALKNGWGKQAGLPVMLMLGSWNICIRELVLTVESTCFRFPTIDDALRVCGMRESKHRGDRMNSILTLAGVKGFVAPKDSNVEASTLEFFEKQGEKGLARALFGSNYLLDDSAHELRRHTWLPVLHRWKSDSYTNGVEDGMRLRVLQNRRLEVRPGDGDELLCYKVRIVVKLPGAELDTVEEGREVVEGVLQSRIIKASGHSTMLDMNLVVPHCTLFLPEAPLYPVGVMCTPTSDMSARLVNPSNINDGDQRRLEEGESFDAHWVTTSRGGSWRILLLHGDDILSGEVSKMGVFKPFNPSAFKELMLTANIRPEKIIIV